MIKLTQTLRDKKRKDLRVPGHMADERRHTKDKTSETQHEKHAQLQKIRREAIVVEGIRESSDGREKEETREEIKHDEVNINKIITRQYKTRCDKRNR